MSTREQLLISAKRLLQTDGYQNASVAAICRKARVANSSFYQYFPDKIALYREIIDELTEQFVAALKQASKTESTPIKKLKAMNQAYLKIFAREWQNYQIFREAEFIDQGMAKSFYEPIVNLYQNVLAKGQNERLAISQDLSTTAWMIAGLQEFVATRWLIWGKDQLKQFERDESEDVCLSTERFILNGLGFKNDSLKDSSGLRRVTSYRDGRESSRRKSLLLAAEKHFGALGYHKASVSEITRDAGVAQGTFYIYFPSKLAIFSQLVQEINDELIETIRRATEKALDRRTIETLGFQAFFGFIGEHPLAYRIVREAEFVDQETGQGYYRRIAAGYIKGLLKAMNRKEIDKYPAETLAYCLMGIGHFVGMKWLVWQNKKSLPGPIFREVMRFISNGIEPA